MSTCDTRFWVLRPSAYGPIVAATVNELSRAQREFYERLGWEVLDRGEPPRGR